MKSFKPLLLIIGGALIILSSCYKDDSLYYEQLDVTITRYDPEFDFSSYTTFTIPDSTSLKTNYMTDEEIEAFFAPGGPSEKTLELIKEKFVERGYSYAMDSAAAANADFIAFPTVLKVRKTGAVYYPPGWWWGYPGWGYPGWGYPGYPWNPGYVSYYSYKEGSIVFEMIDGDSWRALEDWDGEPGSNPPDFLVRWVATVDGYLTSNDSYNQERAQRGIDEAFDQSPYLIK